MKNYYIMLEKLLKSLRDGEVYLQDYIRVKRSNKYDLDIFGKFGIMIFNIQDLKFDNEIVKYSEKDEYEIILVKDLLFELINLIKYSGTLY